MTDTTPQRLPRGRHGLSRDEVETSQRVRMLVAMADAVMEKGYVGTSVADVIKRAGVSRETFYQMFSSKADCFMKAFDAAAEVLMSTVETVAHLDRATLARDDDRDAATRVAQFEQVFGGYLEALAANPAYARLFLVEVYAAGPEALHTRFELQRRIVDTLAGLLGATDDTGRFACEMLVAAVGALVTEPLMANDLDGLRALRQPVVEVVRRALAVGSR